MHVQVIECDVQRLNYICSVKDDTYFMELLPDVSHHAKVKIQCGDSSAHELV